MSSSSPQTPSKPAPRRSALDVMLEASATTTSPLDMVPNTPSLLARSQFDGMITARPEPRRQTQWRACPVCAASETQHEPEENLDGGTSYIVTCTNLECASNGGSNAEALLERLQAEREHELARAATERAAREAQARGVSPVRARRVRA